MEKQETTNNICQVCKGNGYIKIPDPEDKKEINIHQCWECDSKGEYNAVSLENGHLLDDDDYWNYVPRSIPNLK
jgi:hypothetical protein